MSGGLQVTILEYGKRMKAYHRSRKSCHEDHHSAANRVLVLNSMNFESVELSF